MWPICGFNKTVPHAIQPMKQFNYCTRHFLFFRFGNQNWPPTSCDLIPLDFFLWDYLKSKVYANNPTTIRALQEEIKRCIKEILPQLCRKVMKNFDERVRMCQQSRRDHLLDVLFHK